MKEYCDNLNYGHCNQNVMEAQLSNLRALLDQKNSEIRELQQQVQSADMFSGLVEIKDAEIERLIGLNFEHRGSPVAYRLA